MTGAPRAARRWVVVSSAALAAAGLATSAYLTWGTLTSPDALACPAGAVLDCGKALTHAAAKPLGVPLAVHGLVFFAAMLALCTPAAWRSARSWVGRVRLAGAAAGALAVPYLVYLELFVVEAICVWCTVVHVVAVALFAVLLWERLVPVYDDDGDGEPDTGEVDAAAGVSA